MNGCCRKRDQFVNCSMHVTFVDAVGQLAELRADLEGASCVALDVEWRPGGLRGAPGSTDSPAKEGPAALLQLAVWNGEICTTASEPAAGNTPARGARTLEAPQVGAAAEAEAVRAAMGEPVKTFVIDLLRLGVRFASVVVGSAVGKSLHVLTPAEVV